MNAVLILEGGIVHEVLMDKPGKIILIDHDTEGADPEKIKTLFGKEAYVSQNNEVDPERVGKYFSELGEIKHYTDHQAEYVKELIQSYSNVHNVELTKEQFESLELELNKWLDNIMDNTLSEVINSRLDN